MRDSGTAKFAVHIVCRSVATKRIGHSSTQFPVLTASLCVLQVTNDVLTKSHSVPDAFFQACQMVRKHMEGRSCELKVVGAGTLGGCGCRVVGL